MNTYKQRHDGTVAPEQHSPPRRFLRLTNKILSSHYGINNSKMRLKMESIIPRFFKAPKESFFLFGPAERQVHLAARGYEKCLWIDLLDPEELRSYSARPERVRESSWETGQTYHCH